MVYTVNEVSDLARLRDNLPGGIITDGIGIVEEARLAIGE